jgi:hypothetical protein
MLAGKLQLTKQRIAAAADLRSRERDARITIQAEVQEHADRVRRLSDKLDALGPVCRPSRPSPLRRPVPHPPGHPPARPAHAQGAMLGARRGARLSRRGAQADALAVAREWGIQVDEERIAAQIRCACAPRALRLACKERHRACSDGSHGKHLRGYVRGGALLPLGRPGGRPGGGEACGGGRRL